MTLFLGYSGLLSAVSNRERLLYETNLLVRGWKLFIDLGWSVAQDEFLFQTRCDCLLICYVCFRLSLCNQRG